MLLLAALGLLPTADEASAISVDHTVGNVDATITDQGRITALSWNGVNQLCLCPNTVDTEVGVALDQANYDHTLNDGGGGPSDDDGYFLADAFETDFTVTSPIYFEEDTPTKQRSYTVFDHTGADADDLYAPLKEVGDVSIAQTAWTAAGKDWLIVRWEVMNLKLTSITELRFTVYGSYSGMGGFVIDPIRGVGDSAANDVESWDSVQATYYVRDLFGAVGATTMAVSSADAADPLDRYRTYSMQPGARNMPDDNVLYGMVTADPNGLAGGGMNGISADLGWALLFITSFIIEP